MVFVPFLIMLSKLLNSKLISLLRLTFNFAISVSDGDGVKDPNFLFWQKRVYSDKNNAFVQKRYIRNSFSQMMEAHN